MKLESTAAQQGAADELPTVGQNCLAWGPLAFSLQRLSFPLRALGGSPFAECARLGRSSLVGSQAFELRHRLRQFECCCGRGGHTPAEANLQVRRQVASFPPGDMSRRSQRRHVCALQTAPASRHCVHSLRATPTLNYASIRRTGVAPNCGRLR